ncbi:ABC transporter ATP-binding protein [Spirochaeta lutea]|uniref:ABC transporter ATP-binding protein n=1 Tax=Spirochaeta lutea TaxID=1480694 RepID=UPI0006893303|nr:ABC transporter ATP-binding protein [Spirochaeta lutea]
MMIQVSHVTKVFSTPGGGRRVLALDDVSLEVPQGVCYGVVGESGSGKTTLGRILLGLLIPEDGQVLLQGQPVPQSPGEARRSGFFTQAQMVFQDTFGTLNPFMQVQDILLEPLKNMMVPRDQWSARMQRVCELVGFPWSKRKDRPGQLSGGLRQRLSIARALTLEPCVLVLDEPVASLDVSIQARILNLLQELRRELGLTYVFISHDLDIIEYMSDHIGILYQGRLVEQGSATDILQRPQHEYSKILMATQAHHYDWYTEEE